VLDNNSTHLVKLHLDIIQWEEAADLNWDDGDNGRNFFTKRILKLPAGKSTIKFPILETLSLSAVSFQNAVMKMVQAFNFSCLQSLTLRRCPVAEDFLLEVIHSGKKINLKSLEIQVRVADNVFAARSIARFLFAFRGLEDLYFAFPGPIPDPISFFPCMAHHKATLKRLVCQQMIENLDPDSSHFGEEYDLTNLSLQPSDIVRLDVYPSQHPFMALELECIGLCCGTLILVRLKIRTSMYCASVGLTRKITDALVVNRNHS
jgi:hypothetical protein